MSRSMQAVPVGVDCASGFGAEQRWTDVKPLEFGPYAHGGELAHLSDNRLPA